MESYERSFSFTMDAERSVAETVEDLNFPNMDAGLIFQTLQNRLRVVPFSDYLKRYVYLRSGMFGSFREIPLASYQATIIDSFRETGTPASFNRSKTKLQTRVNDWLGQTAVRRNVVLLLGFGLNMNPEDVDCFLQKALHERCLDLEDPQEAICAYCYERHYGFSKMEQLYRVYTQADSKEEAKRMIEQNHPANRDASRVAIEEDLALIHRLLPRREYQGATTLRNRTKFHFDRLYAQACEVASTQMAQSYGHTGKVSPKDLEDMLCSPIPRNQHGNLIPESKVEVRAWMAGKRFSRQHLHVLLHGETEPSRYDLITLRFLICACSVDHIQEPRARYQSFLEDMNHILSDCGFGPMYAADPYESFILMCILSEDPLTTYSDVLELSYSEHGQLAV